MSRVESLLMEGHAEVQGLLAQLKLEEKIKQGAENMLHEFNEQKYKMTSQHKKQVVVQLQAASTNIDAIKDQLKNLGHSEDDHSPISESPPISRAEPANILRSIGMSTTSLIPQQVPPRRRSLTVDSSPQQFSNLFDSLDHREDVQVSSSKVLAIETLLLKYPLLRAELSVSQMIERLRPFIQSPDSLVLAIGFHICRVLSNSRSAVAMLRQHLCVDYYIVRSLSRTDANAEYTERVQVIQLVQSILEIHDGVEEISQGVTRAIVAVAELPSDKLRDSALATIGQIAVCDPKKAYNSGAISVMVDMMVGGQRDMAVSITYVFCSLLDVPENRRMLRNGKDLNAILCVFTDYLADSGAVEPTTERLQITIEVICVIINSWAGLECFDLSSLVQCLVIPVRVIQNAILDIFIFSMGTTPEKVADDPGESNQHFRNHFIAYLLQRLSKVGLHDHLYSLRSDTKFHPAIREKANRLSGYMIRISSQVLPPELISTSTTLPETLADNLNRSERLNIVAAGEPIFQMNKAIRAPERLDFPKMQYSNGNHAKHTHHQVIELGHDSKVWIKMGSQMDEASFRNLMNSTSVLLTKNFPRWNWDALLELIQGPLHNPKRLDEACKSTRFMKRLMSFYRPFKYRFSSVKNTPQNRKYIHVGKELVLTLLETTEGVRYLGANKLLRQIAECLAQLDPTSGITSTEPLLSAQRVRATLTCGYFEIIGVMSRSQQGLNILSQLKIFNMLYNICDTDRTDVIRLFLTALDYSFNSHPRLILAKALVRGQKPVRIYSTKFLQTLGERGRHNWVIDLLVTQLYDTDMDVCKTAVTVILELSRDTDYLDHLISLKPSLEHLGPMSDSIYIVFMSRPAGYKHLAGFDFITQIMDEWVHGYNEKYVREIEEYMGPENLLSRPPQHFFGELVLTREGSKLLSEKHYISMFHDFIIKNGGTHASQTVLKLKGYMWALGYIASKSLGASLISPEIVQSICDVYLQSQVFSVQGTAFYVLGLIASSFEGAEVLNQTGWATAVSPFGDQVGVALIKDMDMVEQCSIPISGNDDVQSQDTFDFGVGHSLNTPKMNSESFTASPCEERGSDLTNKEILSAISDLGNQILANEASRKLVTLKQQHEESFHSVELFKNMMQLLESYHYKQMARRFLFEIFDTQNIIDKMARKRTHKPVISRPN